jgi:hypothetical protein
VIGHAVLAQPGSIERIKTTHQINVASLLGSHAKQRVSTAFFYCISNAPHTNLAPQYAFRPQIYNDQMMSPIDGRLLKVARASHPAQLTHYCDGP